MADAELKSASQVGSCVASRSMAGSRKQVAAIGGIALHTRGANGRIGNRHHITTHIRIRAAGEGDHLIPGLSISLRTSGLSDGAEEPCRQDARQSARTRLHPVPIQMRTIKRRSALGICVALLAATPLRADECTPQWGGGFPFDNGLNGIVRSLAVFDDGTGPALYVGGQFTAAGGVPANHIARWDGTTWQPLGTGPDNGVDGTVWTMAVHDDGTGPALYVGGDFLYAGDLQLNRIAKWDGLAWSPLNCGTNGGVYALAEHDDGSGNALYVGGIFTQADGITVNRIARWRSSTFSAVGSGVTGTGAVMVRALASFDSGSGPRLYAAGQFSGPGKNIAVWNGGTWSTLAYNASFGTSNPVNTMVVFDDGGGDDLYVGGPFTSAGDSTHNCVNCRRIARWDGVEWSALGSGLLDSNVNALTVYDDGNGSALYAAGQFTRSGDNLTEIRRIAKWDGTTWSPLSVGLVDDTSDPCWCVSNCNCGPRPAVGNALTVFNGALHVGGDFVNVTCLEAVNLVRWQCPQPGASRADLDFDDDVDLKDFELFAACFTGPNVGPPTTCCMKADFDGDSDVDQDDFGVYQRCYAGPDTLPPADCDRTGPG